jgi:hypothetical protein
MTAPPLPRGIEREVRSALRQTRGAVHTLYGAASRAEAHSKPRAAVLWLAHRSLLIALGLIEEALFGRKTTTKKSEAA